MDVAASDQTTALVYTGEEPRIGAALILAHGAGAGQHSPFMAGFANALAALGADLITFNFLYTERKRRLPDRAPVLESCYRAVIAAVRDRVDSAQHALFIGGKSMGGRIDAGRGSRCRLAADVRAARLPASSAPADPTGFSRCAPSRARPMLFVQGRVMPRHAGKLAPILARVAPAPADARVSGGDHSFSERAGSGR